MAAQFAALGVAVEVEADAGAIEVWRPHWQAIQLLLAVQTQWRVVGTPAGIRWVGLDYTAVEAAIRLRGFAVSPQTFEDLAQLEKAAIPALNEG